MAYRDVITFRRLKDANTGEVVANLVEVSEQAEATISAVSSLLRQRLGRVLVVEEVTQRFAEHHWTDDETRPGDQARTYADQQPVVEVASGDVGVQGQRYFTAPRRQLGEVTYFAGWRRPGQVLPPADSGEDALPTGDGEALDGLTTLPDVIPGIIQEVAVNITLHVLQNRAQGNLGRRTQQSFGEQQVTVEGADPEFLQRQLGRLSEFDRSHVVGAPYSY